MLVLPSNYSIARSNDIGCNTDGEAFGCLVKRLACIRVPELKDYIIGRWFGDKSPLQNSAFEPMFVQVNCGIYTRGADKSLARPGRK